MTETQLQIKVFTWFATQYRIIPELVLAYHIPNEGKKDAKTAGISKMKGTKSGVPDICIPVPNKYFGALYIELKVGKNDLSDNQEKYTKALIEVGNRVVVCWSLEEVQIAVREYFKKCN